MLQKGIFFFSCVKNYRIYKYADVCHFTFLTAGHQTFPTSLSSPLYMCTQVHSSLLVCIGPGLASKQLVMSQNELVVPPLKIRLFNEHKGNLHFQQTNVKTAFQHAHTQFVTVKLKHSTPLTRRKTHFSLEGDLKR